MKRFTEENTRPIPCIDVLVFNDENQLLLIKRAVEPQKGVWSIIGGRVEVSDINIEATVLREVKEETGLDVRITGLVGQVTSSTDQRFWAVQTIYTAQVISGELKESEEVDQFRWVSVKDAQSENLAFNHGDMIDLYVEKKEKDAIISWKRRVFNKHFDTGFTYQNNDIVRYCANAIIMNDKRELLLCKRAQKPYVGGWDFPGGHMHVGETIEQCLKRELKEELGVNAKMGELFHVYSDIGHSPKAADVISFYFAQIDSLDFVRNIEMQDFAFFPLDKMPTTIAYNNEVTLKDLADYIT